jgi:hypothetical protein
MPGIPNGIPHSSVPVGVTFDFLGLSLMDMAKEVSQQSNISFYTLKFLSQTGQCNF